MIRWAAWSAPVSIRACKPPTHFCNRWSSVRLASRQRTGRRQRTCRRAVERAFPGHLHRAAPCIFSFLVRRRKQPPHARRKPRVPDRDRLPGVSREFLDRTGSQSGDRWWQGFRPGNRNRRLPQRRDPAGWVGHANTVSGARLPEEHVGTLPWDRVSGRRRESTEREAAGVPS